MQTLIVTAWWQTYEKRKKEEKGKKDEGKYDK
jgi:hypothetical protein